MSVCLNICVPPIKQWPFHFWASGATSGSSIHMAKIAGKLFSIMEYVRFRYLNLRIRPMKEVREYTTRYYQATVNPFGLLKFRMSTSRSSRSAIFGECHQSDCVHWTSTEVQFPWDLRTSRNSPFESSDMPILPFESNGTIPLSRINPEIPTVYSCSMVELIHLRTPFFSPAPNPIHPWINPILLPDSPIFSHIFPWKSMAASPLSSRANLVAWPRTTRGPVVREPGTTRNQKRGR